MLLDSGLEKFLRGEKAGASPRSPSPTLTPWIFPDLTKSSADFIGTWQPLGKTLLKVKHLVGYMRVSMYHVGTANPH